MKVAYANIAYEPGRTAGGNAHVYQFIKTAKRLGHEVWTWPEVSHPYGQSLPLNRIKRALRLRECEAIIFRIEATPPERFRLLTGLKRRILGPKKIVWEFNTVPEYAYVQGGQNAEIEASISGFRRLANRCDLAVCVSARLADYVATVLGVRNVVAIPNGSDPEVFTPSLPAVPESRKFEGYLNVVWLGSAHLAWADIDLLVEAARRTWDSELRDKVRFHIIGEGMESRENLPPNISCHGGQAYELVPAWLTFMDVGLVLYKEGPAEYSSPLKLFDYLASGLAIISTDQPQASEILRELGQEACVLHERDPVLILNILGRFACDRNLLRAFKSSSRSLAVERYSWKHTVSAVFDAISQA